MELSFALYKDKVAGCWAGKNIGGVLGAPFEGKRCFNAIDFYAQDLSKGPPPNDDLDLQIIWLCAAERFGRQVNASILGEYWLSFVIPDWVEYGTGKANLRAGLMPPLSGHTHNRYRNSCGCFIRSEIWACLAPGNPEIAARYAFEDGSVDHSGEGVYGEVFCAALESAAFVESDAMRLIDIALSYIPDQSAVARCVKKAVECYQNKLPLREARIRLHNESPGTFGLLGLKKSEIPAEDSRMAIGAPGFDCPENIGILVLGWLYGEGDFGASLCAAVACGEDTDCTAATLGAILGIIRGASGIPEKWSAPLNDQISTICINKVAGGAVRIPETVTELTDHVLRVTPLFLGSALCDILHPGGYTITCREGDDLYLKGDAYLTGHQADAWPRVIPADALIRLDPHIVRYAFPTFTVMVDHGGSLYFERGRPRRVKLTLINNNLMYQQMWCTIKTYGPPGVLFPAGAEFSLHLNTLAGDRGECVITVDPAVFEGARLELLFDISFAGRHTAETVRAVLLRRPDGDFSFE